MAPDDGGRVEAELVSHFKDLGLNKYEAQTLINLVKLGSGTAKDIARVNNNVPRTRVYDAAESLHELGLVDIQYSTPQKFTVISRETLVRKLNNDREDTIESVSDRLLELEPAEPQREELGVWTVSGHETVADRAREFVEDTDERIVIMSIDDLLTDDLLHALGEASSERDVDVYIGGSAQLVEDRIRDEVPDVTLFESLWDWTDAPAGRLLVADESSALVSAMVDDSEVGGLQETAIWGQGDRNSLVVVLRAIFTWRLDAIESEHDG